MPKLVLSSFLRPSAETVISRVSIAGQEQANNSSHDLVISADGRFAVFQSYATNLAASDANGSDRDIFLKDLVTGEVVQVSANADGVGGTYESVHPHMSADGRYAVFVSGSSNLVEGDTNGRWDVFRKDMVTGEMVLVTTTASGTQSNTHSFTPKISSDGRYVIFASSDTNLVEGDTNERMDIFRKDMVTGEVVQVSTNADGVGGNADCSQLNMSADGRYVVFQTWSSNLVENDTNQIGDVFRKDLVTGEIVRVSETVNAAGETVEGDAASSNAFISADGRYVFFESDASNLVAGDTNNASDIFRKDLVTGEIVRLSNAPDGTLGNGFSHVDGITADGRFVTFTSGASNLVSGDTNGEADVFVLDTSWLPLAPAIAEKRHVQLQFETGTAHQVSLAWGDGSTDTVTPVNGLAGFSHTYASVGLKNALATVSEGSLTWVVPYLIDLAAGSMSRDADLADTLTGSGANETLAGDGFANRLCGESGKDRLFGDDGNDVLYGGFGNDRLAGGAGKDVFAFDSRILPTTKKNQKKNFDQITDFKRAEDDLWLDNGIFTRLGKKGSADNPQKLKKAFFTLGTEAKDQNDFIVYDRKKGILYYDKDGSGEAEAIAFAKLKKGAALKALDLFVI